MLRAMRNDQATFERRDNGSYAETTANPLRPPRHPGQLTHVRAGLYQTGWHHGSIQM